MERVVRFTEGKTFADYLADEYFRSAVERQLEIIGEALAQLRRVDPTTAAKIPELPRVVGFRNVIVHGYATLDNRVVWGLVESNVCPLGESLRRLLEEV